MSSQYGERGLLAAEIDPSVWGTPARPCPVSERLAKQLSKKIRPVRISDAGLKPAAIQ